ncbi:hypothetical protein [Nocardioides sp. KR10-350]|uniref:hypothetical protein n=1 Tax=Nocardioides cheoyonin TaxID=3156615 RepID=UPI0032B40594
MRSLAKTMRCSAASLMNWFETKDRMLWLASRAFADHWRFELGYRVGTLGWAGFLPYDERDRQLTVRRRIWSELGRNDPRIGAVMAEVVLDEESLLADFLRYLGVSEEAVIAEARRLHVFLLGLWIRMTEVAEPLAREEAETIWRALGGPLGV